MNSKMQNTKPALILILATVLLLTLIAANLAFGTMTIPVSEVIKALMGKSLDNEVWQNVILRTRWPQTIVAFGAGMALGISGLLMQTLFRESAGRSFCFGHLIRCQFRCCFCYPNCRQNLRCLIPISGSMGRLCNCTGSTDRINECTSADSPYIQKSKWHPRRPYHGGHVWLSCQFHRGDI